MAIDVSRFARDADFCNQVKALGKNRKGKGQKYIVNGKS